VKGDFGVAMRVKVMAKRLQLPPQLRMIVDFAIEDNDGVLVIAEDGLIAAFEIDDFQPYGAQRDVA